MRKSPSTNNMSERLSLNENVPKTMFTLMVLLMISFWQGFEGGSPIAVGERLAFLD